MLQESADNTILNLMNFEAKIKSEKPTDTMLSSQFDMPSPGVESSSDNKTVETALDSQPRLVEQAFLSEKMPSPKRQYRMK